VCGKNGPCLSEETWMAGNVNMNVREVIREIRLAPGPEPKRLSLSSTQVVPGACSPYCVVSLPDAVTVYQTALVLDFQAMCRIVRSE
jgi:hypothetical protein